MKKLLTSLLCVMMVVCFMPAMAWATEVNTVSTAEELKAAVASGGTIQLSTDIDLGTLSTTSGVTNAGITIAVGTTVILDLNGYTLSASLGSDKNTYSKLHVILNNGNLTIQDSSNSHEGKIINTKSDSYACTRTVKNAATGTLKITGGTIESTSAVGLLNLGNCTIEGENTVVKSTKAGYSGGWDNACAAIENRENGVLSINGGSFSSVSEAVLFCDGDNKTIINGGTFNGNTKYGDINGDAGPELIEIRGGTWTSTDPTDYVGLFCAIDSSDGKYSVEKKDVNAISIGSGDIAAGLNQLNMGNPGHLIITGNVSLDSTATLPANSKITINGGAKLTIEKSGVLDYKGEIENNGEIEIEGYLSYPTNVIGTGTLNKEVSVVNGEYLIKTPMDLQWLSYLSAKSEMPTNIALANDITMPSSVDFQPINEGENIIFSGNNHTISNLQIDEYGGFLGLFVWLGQSSVKDLNLECNYATNTGYVGGLVGQSASSTFENVTVNGSITAKGASYGVGGIAGSVYQSSDGKTMFINCTNSASIGGSAAYNVGSMFGTSSGSFGEILIYNSTNKGAITAAGSMGYVFGFGYMNSSGTLEIIGFSNTGTVNGLAGTISTASGSSGYNYSDSTADGEDFIAVEKNDGTWIAVSTIMAAHIDGVAYDDIDSALSAAADGDTITLLKDSAETIQIPSDKALTVNLNGYSIAGIQLSEGSGNDIYLQNNRYIVLKSGSEAPAHSTGKNTWSKNSEGVYIESYVAPYVPPTTPTVQKPDVTAAEGATVTLSSDGTTLTIKANDGYEITHVTVNGVSKGAVDKLTGLKTGDKVVITAKKIETPGNSAALIEAVKNTKLVARSANAKAPSGKKAIKVTWYAKDGSDLDFDGYEVYRSLKRYSGFGKTPFFKTTNEKYYNTAIKKGTKYYYKVRAYKVINGERVYTDWSTKAWRTVK